MEMKKYPMLEPAQSSNPQRYQQEVPFWSMVVGNTSILSHPEGLVHTLATQIQPNVNYLFDYLQPHFTNIPSPDLHTILMSTLIALELKLILIHWKEAKKPNRWDSDEQSEVLATLRKNLKGKDPAHQLRLEADRCGTGTPQRLIYDGMRLHLEGPAELGALKLLELEKAYQPTNEELRRFLQFRTAKALAGAGHFRQSNKRYSELARRQVGLERAETIREQCNLFTQMAWTWPRAQTYQEELQTLLEQGKKALGRKAPPSVQYRFAKIEASFREFTTTLRLLKTPASGWKRRDLKNIKDAIKDLMKADPGFGVKSLLLTA